MKMIRIGYGVPGLLSVVVCACATLPPIQAPEQFKSKRILFKEIAVTSTDKNCEGYAETYKSITRGTLEHGAKMVGLVPVSASSSPYDVAAIVQVRVATCGFWGKHAQAEYEVDFGSGAKMVFHDQGGYPPLQWLAEPSEIGSALQGDEYFARRLVSMAPEIVKTIPSAKIAAAQTTVAIRDTTPAAKADATVSFTPPPASGTALPNSTAMAASQPNAYAIIVGIEKYRDLPAAQGARGDAEAFAVVAQASLGVPKNQILVAYNERAGRSDIEKHVEWLGRNVRKSDRIYFFFSGHGGPDPSTGESYVIPFDGDPSYLKRTALKLSLLLESLQATGAREIIAFVDACFSGSGVRSVLPSGIRPITVVKDVRVKGPVLLFSASSGSETSGPSFDGRGGLFSRVVVEGLTGGKADIDGDGEISARELYDWVRPRVKREARRANRDQTPSLSTGNNTRPEDVVLSNGFAQ
jgi:hypothetical protein